MQNQSQISTGTNMSDRMIITAGSDAFGPSVLALIGSLDLNWPGHAPILVYDIGLDFLTIKKLQKHNITISKVPHFCPHWRKHFTWKIWCLTSAPAKSILWIDAGVVILGELDEVFEQIEKHGHFFIPSFHKLSENAPDYAIKSTGLSHEVCSTKTTISGNFMGFNKASSPTSNLLQEILALAIIEQNIAATTNYHKHDQALISLVFYKHYNTLKLNNGYIYGGWEGPNQVSNQKVWAHRRNINPADLKHFTKSISQKGPPYIPTHPESNLRKPLSLLSMKLFIKRNLHRAASRKGAPYNGVKY